MQQPAPASQLQAQASDLANKSGVEQALSNMQERRPRNPVIANHAAGSANATAAEDEPNDADFPARTMSTTKGMVNP